jgi:hypothetical protein
MSNTNYDARLAVEPHEGAPGLWAIAAAASYAGMSVRLLVAGIERGDIPVTLRRIGKSRKQFVNAEQLQKWVNAPASENLFA